MAPPSPTSSSPQTKALLSRSFYNRKTELVARELLGKYLVRHNKIARITETEAYLGPHDLASHSRFGITKRNQVMFGPAGHAYIYLIYGLHHCLNIVTEPQGHGSAVLIRALDFITGPGLLCKAMNIDLKLNGIDLTRKGELYILDSIPESKIISTPRIGINYAGEWKDKPLRYVLANS